MPDSIISVIDLATQHGLLKQTIFKVIKRLGVEPTKRLGANSRGQVVAYITQDEARMVVEALRSRQSSGVFEDQDSSSIIETVLDGRGVFYLLSLEPKSDPGRF